MPTNDYFLSVRLKPDDYDKLMAICDASGLTPSKAVRSLIRQTEIKPRQPEGYRELTVAVNRIGTNINQIARAVNGKIATANDVEELKTQMRKVYELMYQAMAA